MSIVETKNSGHLLWLLVLLLPTTYFVQEMVARLGVATGQGHASMIIVGVQVLAGVMLPSAVIFLQLLLNDKELLGERFANKPWNNWVNWTIIVVLFVLSLVLAVQVIAPNLIPAS